RPQNKPPLLNVNAMRRKQQPPLRQKKIDRLMQQRKPLRRPEPLLKKQKRCRPVVQPQIN
ncbi:hypothetical protein QUH12_33070, partial [Klebsiella pneumoniae]|nr:hypothetical protein [Klebsiella pneumoniae]